jgi:hypothetical protein
LGIGIWEVIEFWFEVVSFGAFAATGKKLFRSEISFFLFPPRSGNGS